MHQRLLLPDQPVLPSLLNSAFKLHQLHCFSFPLLVQLHPLLGQLHHQWQFSMPKLLHRHPKLPQLFKQFILWNLHRYHHVLISKWILPPLLLPALWLYLVHINNLHEMRPYSFLPPKQHLPMHIRYTCLRIVHWCWRLCKCLWINWWD